MRFLTLILSLTFCCGTVIPDIDGSDEHMITYHERHELPHYHVPSAITYGGHQRHVCKSALCAKRCPKKGHVVSSGPKRNSNMLTATLLRNLALTQCHFKCVRLCKRSVNQVKDFCGNKNYEVVAMPTDFKHYDLNGDKRISWIEMSLSEHVPARETKQVFRFADFNGDGFLSDREFRAAPFVFTVQMASELNAMSKDATVFVPRSPRRRRRLSPVAHASDTGDK